MAIQDMDTGMDMAMDILITTTGTALPIPMFLKIEGAEIPTITEPHHVEAQTLALGIPTTVLKLPVG